MAETATPASKPTITLTSGLTVEVAGTGTGEDGNARVRPEAQIRVTGPQVSEPIEFIIGFYDGLASFPTDHREQFNGCGEFMGGVLDYDTFDEAVEEFEETLYAFLKEMDMLMGVAAIREAEKPETAFAAVGAVMEEREFEARMATRGSRQPG